MVDELTTDDISAEEDIESRQRRERKQLQAKIQELKKAAPKNDKKKRKEVISEISRLENEMMQRHTSEKLAELSLGSSNKDLNSVTEFIGSVEQTEPALRVSKAQKRREKKERDARKRAEDVQIAAREARTAPKAVETTKILNKLRDRDLSLYEISSDGDCLYNAIRHQLQLHGLGHHTVKELRCETANYIHTNKSSLIHYMTSSKTGDLMDDNEFESYCQAVRSTPAWGGQVELKALSSVLKVPIEILQAEGPTTVQGNEFTGPNLTITYHRHMYSLGEHYNSTMPATGDESE